MNSAPMLTDAVTVRSAGIDDASTLLDLHRAGFDSDWTMADWRHRYVDNLDGGPSIVGAFTSEGVCVAAFCGVLMPAKFGGKVRLACRGGDVAVHPDLRKTAAGPKLLLRVCSTYANSLSGGEVGAIFGFPQPGLLRTLVRHCRYEVMADVMWLMKPVSEHGQPSSELQTSIAETVPDDSAAFLHECMEQVDAGVVRNLNYLRWRYERNPRGSYVTATVRSRSGTLTGLAILRREELEDGALLINEWLVRRGDANSRQALLGAVESLARQLGRKNVVTSFAVSSPEFGEMQELHGFHVAPAPYQFTVRPYSSTITRSYMFHNWLHTPGDLDFT